MPSGRSSVLELVAAITPDDYHNYDREARKHLDSTPLHPDAANIAALESDTARLKAGQTITKPVYNHNTGKFDAPVQFAPQKILILSWRIIQHRIFVQERG